MFEGRWQDRYLYSIKDVCGDPEEGLASVEKLTRDTGKVGDAAVRCLERMSSDGMESEVVGMVLLLIEYREMQKNE